MNKAEMADRLAARTGLNKAAARDEVNSVFAAIGEALANGEEVRIAGFGTFTARTRPARTVRNPRTGEAISISASKSPSFKAGKAIRGKDSVVPGWRRQGRRNFPVLLERRSLDAVLSSTSSRPHRMITIRDAVNGGRRS